MLEMVEQYERCYYLGAYTGQECELCPHRDECMEKADGIKEILRSESKGYMRMLRESNGKGRQDNLFKVLREPQEV